MENLTWYTSNFLPERKYSPNPHPHHDQLYFLPRAALPLCRPGQVTDTWSDKAVFKLTGFLYKSLPAVHYVQPGTITQSKMALPDFLMFFPLSICWWWSHHLRNMRKEKRKYTALWSQITQTTQYLTADNYKGNIHFRRKTSDSFNFSPLTPDHSSFPACLK